ncbi:MAG: hypothetical protein V1656_01530 [Candidatus Jorgensenbacteria bacterium]
MDERPEDHRRHIIKDAIIVAFSIACAVAFVETGALGWFLNSTRGLGLFGSFLAGIFFTSAFTVAPATVILGGMARELPVWGVAVFGGLGALLGDSVIFRFVERRLVDDFEYLLGKTDTERFVSIFHRRLFRWLFQFAGALVVASPLPDELGLAMMGISKMRASLFVPLSLFLNFVGILAVGLIARAL